MFKISRFLCYKLNNNTKKFYLFLLLFIMIFNKFFIFEFSSRLRSSCSVAVFSFLNLYKSSKDNRLQKTQNLKTLCLLNIPSSTCNRLDTVVLSNRIARVSVVLFDFLRLQDVKSFKEQKHGCHW